MTAPIGLMIVAGFLCMGASLMHAGAKDSFRDLVILSAIACAVGAAYLAATN